MEDKIRIHKEIFTLVYNSNGGFTHDEVYFMPIYLRYFYIKMLVEQKKTEEQQYKNAETPASSGPIKKPVFKK